ncbi:hypothetical protein H4S07_003354 [Coemansia furcata]|uniref:Uncharacterized protein n=1 Tax=Coemansia furcata TaxID=417177 RepID=A0ACC1LHH9_9FUNG|nr:hypothetical protein H4S07_003354 [Coemansia furcata]
MFSFDDCESLRSFDTRASTDSRAYLLSPQPLAANSIYRSREADLEDIMDMQARISAPPLTAQRVELTPAKRRSMQIAEVVSAVSRMGALRYSNQDYHMGRRGLDMERFMAGIDRLSIDKLDEQRYTHR